MDNIKFIAVKVMDDEDGGTLGRPVWTVEWIDKKKKKKFVRNGGRVWALLL